jgi:hypothetical protein
MEAIGMEIPVNGSMPIEKKYEPNPENHQLYMQCFEKFERVYNLVKTEFVRPEELTVEL